MVNSGSDLGRVFPNPILHVFGPGGLELLLADGAGRVAQRGVVGGPDPGLWRPLLRGIAILSPSSLRGGLVLDGDLIISSFAGLDPISFIDVPAAGLRALGGICHALVGLEMPIQMPCLLFPAFLSGEKAAAASSTSVRLCLIERGDEGHSGTRKKM